MFEVSEAYEKAVELRDELKERLATVDAELDGEVRADLESSETKVTEAAVKAAIQTHKKHKAAFDAYLKAKTDAGVLNALKDSFHTRSHGIGHLVDLYNNNYFERTSAHGGQKADEHVYKRRRAAIAEARKK